MSQRNSPQQNNIEDILKIFQNAKEKKDDNVNKPNVNRTIDEFNKKWNMNETIINLFTKNIEKDQNLRQNYAIILIIMLGVQLIALLAIFVLGGLDILKYSDSTFNIFITGGIIEIFILVRVIVKYLFKDNLTNALNIILENNNKINYRTKSKFNKKDNS